MELLVLFALTSLVTTAAVECWPRWRRLATLVAVGLAAYLPALVVGGASGELPGYFAGSAVILLSGWLAWTLFACAICSTVLILMAWQLSAHDIVYHACFGAVLGLTVFGLAWLSFAIRLVDAKGRDVARFAVINERMRFARDMHDLFGYSLSSIILKADFARRLTDKDPGQACDELTELLDVARQALADVRSVAHGYRTMSLAEEARPVQSLLAAAGINTQVDIACGPLDEQLDTVLAIVLREAVTNVLRHSKAENCTVSARVQDAAVRLLIRNDGVASAAAGQHCAGLANLSARLESVGGELTAHLRDGWFSLLAQAPLTPAARPDHGAGND